MNSDIYVRTDSAFNKDPLINEIGDCPKGASECFNINGTKYAQYNKLDVKGGDIRGKMQRGVSRNGCVARC